jgi:hypothetical protein
MTDRYLFRGKRKDNGEWIIGYLGADGQDAYIVDAETRVKERIYFGTIGQCTGEKDKNSALIFEGDILTWPCYTEPLADPVVWCEGGFVVPSEGDHDETPLFEVLNGAEIIGNVHDNPGLLEGV